MSYKILDCTLRDGGYYTDWKFNTKLVRQLVKALDNNNVDIIELGYKSPVIGGPYRKCNDGFINSVLNFEVKADLAIMIYVKDYIINNIDDGKLIVSESIPNIDFQKEVNDISNDLDPLDTLPPYTTLEDLVTDYGGS